MSAPLKKVLYCEDEPDIRTIAEIALGSVGGLQVRLCEHGGLAVQAAREFQPDLIVLDVMMPQLDGPGALRALRADPVLAKIPIVFMTAKAMPGEIASLKSLGALDVIPKPFDPMTLASTLCALWALRPQS